MITLNGGGLDLESFIKVARYKEKVMIGKSHRQKVTHAREFVKDIVDNNETVYGINTGFGKLSDTIIGAKDVSVLQENLIKSHACTVGNVLDEEVVRGMMLLRVNALIRGYSGIRLVVLEKIIELLNKEVTPLVFEKGSLGASGDLAPLSNMSLPIIGLGECTYHNKRLTTQDAFKEADIKPIPQLIAKEGLALINGTQAMTSLAAFTVYDGLRLCDFANVSLALSLEALEGITDAYDDRVHQVRGHQGQITVAKAILKMLTGSESVTRQGEKRVQDAYSLRCAPQVHGASLDALSYVKDTIEIEMNAVTDNPILFADDHEAISAGNFHGQPIALVIDHMKIALSELANISERRLERLVNPQLSEGLPPFLTTQPGTNSGFMIVQYSAASLVSHNKVLAHPASVDSISSSANQEDHVSMGTNGALQAKEILANVRQVIGMEMLTACQAIDLRDQRQLGVTTEKAYNKIREYIPFIEKDETMYPHLHKIDTLLQDDMFYKSIMNEVTQDETD
ncbi:MAG: histidine ammonia-lyase [Candidatus Izemoplasma sp.]|nr:histidine ammonia-lyase [Candidatus Izemoplasma sp.]